MQGLQGMVARGGCLRLGYKSRIRTKAGGAVALTFRRQRERRHVCNTQVSSAGGGRYRQFHEIRRYR